MAAPAPSPSQIQRAWLYREYGPPEVLELAEDFPVPDVAPHEVLVKVSAAALNPIDYKRRLGFLKQNDCPFPHVPGHDVAGIVVHVGNQVTRWKVGDEVYGDLSGQAVIKPKQVGSLAQYTNVDEKLLAHKPSNLSFTEAASLPLALLTAQQGFDVAKFKVGQTILILGGAGGVGTLAIQLSKVVYGASLVATTASTKKLQFVKDLGADVAIDYTQSKYYELPEKYDFVLDTVGDDVNAAKAMKEGGVALTIVNFEAQPPVLPYGLVPIGENLERLNPFLQSGQLKPIIDPAGLFSFSQLIDAFKYLETGRAVGKVVISPIE